MLFKSNSYLNLLVSTITLLLKFCFTTFVFISLVIFLFNWPTPYYLETFKIISVFYTFLALYFICPVLIIFLIESVLKKVKHIKPTIN